MELFDSIRSEHRSPAVRTAIAELARQGEGARGAVFTRTEVVEAILDLVGYLPSHRLFEQRLLEPAVGDGSFLLPAVDRLLASATLHQLGPQAVDWLAPAVRAVEIHPASLEATRLAVRARLLAWGLPGEEADTLCATWLLQDDFLLTALPAEFDVVVGNPPYVRQERIPAPLLAEYRRRYNTLYDRADLYVPFIERSLRLLGPTGRLGFICANRWLKNRYGRPLRELVAAGYHLMHVIELDDVQAFDTEVIAYPTITVLQRGPGRCTRVARWGGGEPGGLRGLAERMAREGPASDARVQELQRVVSGGDPWLLEASSPLDTVRRLERDFPDLEQAGGRVGIGVATGADRLFIGPQEELLVEPSRRLPLAMARDIHGGEVHWGGLGVINPFEPDGRLADLDRYPLLRAWAQGSRAALSSRHCAQRAGAGWYRTIDRIWPELATTPKLLIPDIKGEPTVAFDPGRFYPHHNLYHVTSAQWDLRALATVLRSSIALLLLASYSIRMAGGYLRFQAQYLRRMRVPLWESVPDATRAALVDAPPDDLGRIDDVVFPLYGLDLAEARAVRAYADGARVGRRAK